MLNRREFLTSVGAMAGVTMCRPSGALPASSTAAATTRTRLDRIGIQLYSVRRDMQRDFEGTLARIAEIGYREVEFAGLFGRTPAQVRGLLEKLKLTAPSTHLDFNQMRGPGLDALLDSSKELGHEFFATAWIDASLRRTRDEWSAVAREMNRVGERARARGLRFAFHNHDYELKPIDGRVPLEILLEETDPALVSFEMDIYWLVKGGGDPVAYIRQYPTRFAMLHVKDSAGPPDHRMVDVGDGTIDFGRILRADLQQRHAVRHVFVEHDQPTDPMLFARKSFDYLSKLEF